MIFKTTLRLDEAEKSYKKAISLNPKFAEAYNNLGSLFRKTDGSERQKKILKQLQKFNQNTPRPTATLGPH